jgi:hypothetical protein
LRSKLIGREFYFRSPANEEHSASINQSKSGLAASTIEDFPAGTDAGEVDAMTAARGCLRDPSCGWPALDLLFRKVLWVRFRANLLLVSLAQALSCGPSAENSIFFQAQMKNTLAA